MGRKSLRVFFFFFFSSCYLFCNIYTFNKVMMCLVGGERERKIGNIGTYIYSLRNLTRQLPLNYGNWLTINYGWRETLINLFSFDWIKLQLYK